MATKINEVTKHQIQNIDYSKYGLLDNPFPQNPTIIIESADKRMNGTIFCEGIFEHELSDFEKLANQKTNVIYIRGTQISPGDGKSAIMANAFRRYSKDTTVVTAFIRCTSSSGGVDKPVDYCKEIIRQLHYKIYLWDAFGKLLTKFIKESTKYGYAAGSIDILFQQYPDPPLALPFTLYTHITRPRELAREFSEWLVKKIACNESTAKVFAYEYIENPREFPRKLDKKSDKINDYQSYLKILIAAGYKWCYLFLDQMEESISEKMPKKDIAEFTSGFRRMIEAGDGHATLICTLNQSSSATLVNVPEAEININGFAPFNRNHSIAILPEEILNRGKVMELIQTYITAFHSREVVDKRNHIELFPFEPEVIKYIAYLFKGNLRSILRTLHELLKFGRAKNQSKIDMQFMMDEHIEAIGKEFSKDKYNEYKATLGQK